MGQLGSRNTINSKWIRRYWRIYYDRHTEDASIIDAQLVGKRMAWRGGEGVDASDAAPIAEWVRRSGADRDERRISLGLGLACVTHLHPPQSPSSSSSSSSSSSPLLSSPPLLLLLRMRQLSHKTSHIPSSILPSFLLASGIVILNLVVSVSVEAERRI